MVNISKLTERLIIQIDSNSTGSTTYGEYIPNWKVFKTIYGSITTQKGNLKFDTDTGSQDYVDSISFYCMYQMGININDTKKYRIIYNNLTYTLKSIGIVPFNQATIFECVALS